MYPLRFMPYYFQYLRSRVKILKKRKKNNTKFLQFTKGNFLSLFKLSGLLNLWTFWPDFCDIKSFVFVFYDKTVSSPFQTVCSKKLEYSIIILQLILPKKLLQYRLFKHNFVNTQRILGPSFTE